MENCLCSLKQPLKFKSKKSSNPEFVITIFSYVMKLFDRSVDFAQFGEDTQLYMLARAWMRNKPFGSRAETQEQSTASSPSNSEAAEPTSTVWLSFYLMYFLDI